MARSVPHPIAIIFTLLVLGFSVGPLPTSAQPNDIWLTRAKATAIIGSQSEQSGDLDEALNSYRAVITSAGEALKDAPPSNPVAAMAGNIILASGHIDAARVLQKRTAKLRLQQPGAAPRISDLLSDINTAQHIDSAEAALKKAEMLHQQYLEECARMNSGKSWGQGRQVCINHAQIIKTALGDLQLLRGETAQARSSYAAVAAAPPDSARAKAALAHLDEIAGMENRPASPNQNKIWAATVAVLGADLTRKAAGLVVKELAGRWGPLGSSLTAAGAEALIGHYQDRLKANQAIPK